jgi:hypothetical protein
MRKLSLAIIVALALTSTSVQAEEEYEWQFAAATTDIFIARPFTFAASIVGGALWTVALPITAPTRTVEESFYALVRRPWNLTFKRELGDFNQ